MKEVKYKVNIVYIHIIEQNQIIIYLFAEAAMDRDNFMTAEQAKDFGLVDHMLNTSNLQSSRS